MTANAGNSALNNELYIIKHLQKQVPQSTDRNMEQRLAKVEMNVFPASVLLIPYQKM